MSVIDDWLLGDYSRRDEAFRLKHLYELQANFLYDKYEPTLASHADAAMSFVNRLDRWLANFSSDQDRWAAFRSIRYFLFIGPAEVEELYRCAVENILYPWLAEISNLDIFLPLSQHTQSLQQAIKSCWPCPVTDSLRINGLLHRTSLKGHNIRPDWHSLKVLANKPSISAFVKKNGITSLALFEDFVGSGRQCEEAIEFALNVFDGQILFCPLVICHPGHKAIKKLQSKNAKRLHYKAVVQIDEDCLVGKNEFSTEPKTFAQLRLAMASGYKQIGLNRFGGAFGFNQVGCLYSSYSNCPNNAPPIYHASSAKWPNALFPRAARV